MSRKKSLRFEIRLFFRKSVDPVREQENVVMPNQDTVAPVWEHSLSYNHRVFSDDITTSPRSINLMESCIYLTAI